MIEHVDQGTKLAHYREKLKWARHITDGLGMPIDEKILPLVVWLQLLGIVTDMSCEGHLTYGRHAPWVSFDLQKTTLDSLRCLGELLAAFYETRSVPYDQMIVVSTPHKIGEIECAGAAFQSTISPEKQAQRLLQYQEEMGGFADFLGQCYFAASEQSYSLQEASHG